MTFNWRSYIDALSANVQRVYSKNAARVGGFHFVEGLGLFFSSSRLSQSVLITSSREEKRFSRVVEKENHRSAVVHEFEGAFN